MSRSESFRMAFDAAERNEDLAAFSAREVKRVAVKKRGRDEYSSAEGRWEST